ncbi:MAG: hypothetical protein AB7H71_05430 [Alphaproteobacteria bacterium]
MGANGNQRDAGRPVAVDAPRPAVRGQGSRADAARIADVLTAGLAQGAVTALAADAGISGPIGRVRLRLRAGAGEAEIARAFAEALADAQSGRGPRR